MTAYVTKVRENNPECFKAFNCILIKMKPVTISAALLFPVILRLVLKIEAPQTAIPESVNNNISLINIVISLGMTLN